MMDTPRIRMGHAKGATPPNIFTDFDWVRRNEKALLAQYGECSITVYREQVIGIGPTYNEALEDAERNLPADIQEVTPIHERLDQRHAFVRVRPKVVK
jgi:hypothetical protein